MDINKGLLFLDGAAIGAEAKVLDLGFSGDFDYKNHCWNRLFVCLNKAIGAVDVVLTVYAKNDDLPDTSKADDIIGVLTIPADKAKMGGAFAFPATTGLKRYVTVKVEAAGAGAGAKVTCGFTNDVDSDCIQLGGGIDWANYKASTLGTKVTGTPMQNVAAVIKG